jgi:hypothetical protein
MFSKRIALAVRLLRGGPRKLVLASLHMSILKNIDEPGLMTKLENRVAVEDSLYLFTQEKMILEVFEILTVMTNKFPNYIRFKRIKDQLLHAYIENSAAKNLLVDDWRPGSNGAGGLSQVDYDFISNCIYLDCLSTSIDPIVIEQLQTYLKKT